MVVGIIDYGMGNLHSVQRKLHILSTEFKIVRNSTELFDCDKIILPGVGHFGAAMQKLQSQKQVEALSQAVLVDKKPILGICLGMQLMAETSEEGNAKGLGWIKTKIVKFDVDNSMNFKVPHIGWNTVQADNSKLLDAKENEFYFVHSYHAQEPEENIVVHKTTYEKEFISGFEKENIFGVQYHPEKSHDQGILLLKRFLEL
ncbi:MAG: imidazole glycerol phosphate synthase subunit HisH [Bacteroidota bacterium]